MWAFTDLFHLRIVTAPFERYFSLSKNSLSLTSAILVRTKRSTLCPHYGHAHVREPKLVYLEK